MFKDYSYAVIRCLPIPTKSKLSAIIQVWTVFIISGLLHALLSWSCKAVPPFTGLYERFTSVLLFFLLQPVGFMIEDMVRSIWRHKGPDDHKGSAFATNVAVSKSTINLLGRIWTICWLFFTVRFAMEAWLKTEQGMLVLPFNVLRKHPAIPSIPPYPKMYVRRPA